MIIKIAFILFFGLCLAFSVQAEKRYNRVNSAKLIIKKKEKNNHLAEADDNKDDTRSNRSTITNLPSVPANALQSARKSAKLGSKEKNHRKTKTKPQQKEEAPPTPTNNEDKSKTVILDNRPIRLNIKPGVNEIIPISKGHINRIITPFPQPKVNTASNVTVTNEGNVLYLSTQSDIPVTLFITAQDNQAIALSLTLLPKDIPPKEITLALQSINPFNPFKPVQKNQPFYENADYVNSIKNIFRTLATGKVPDGYSLRAALAEDNFQCNQIGMQTRVGQVMEGTRLAIMVAKITNVSEADLELNEPACANSTTLAIASFPSNKIAPNETIEIYAILLKPELAQNVQNRPSLLAK